MSDPIVIVAAARTPMGGLQGDLSALAAPMLGATAIAGCLQRAAITPDRIDQVLMGCVLPAGQGQAPARQAARGAGLVDAVACTTINKMCGSGMKAVMLAASMLRSHEADCIIAGGMESMSNAPYLLDRARGGYRMGHGRVLDHMFLDGLEDAYDKGRLMGSFAEECASQYHFTRSQQDEFAIRSLQRALQAGQDGTFKAEIVPVVIKDKKGDILINDDEQPKKARPDKIPKLKPAFAKDGTVTAANASSISDGAAALLLMRESTAKAGNHPILARILGASSHAQHPSLFTTAPVGAMQKLLRKLDLQAQDIDLYEINEAFAVVTMAAMHELGLSADKVNIHGGACALGHPIGASGARILVTLLHGLQKYGQRRGMASLCIGGGEATAMAIELI